MAKEKNKIHIEVSRSGGHIPFQQQLEKGLSLSPEDWEEIKAICKVEKAAFTRGGDSYLYTFMHEKESIVLSAEIMPAKWQKKIRTIDKALDA